MTVSKKKRRKISVDGREYWWTISPDDGYVVIVVELKEGIGAKLLGYCCPYPNLPTQNNLTKVEHRSISSSSVANFIRFAFKQGWNPYEKGKHIFQLRDIGSVLWPIFDN